MDIFFLWNLFFNNEDDEDDDDDRYIRERHLKINNYYENNVLLYSATDFKSHFRIIRNTFEQLIQDLGQDIIERANSPKLPVVKQIAITLWILGNQEVYRSVADRFGTSKDTIWRCVFNVAYVLLQHVQNYIKWPEVHQLLNIQQEFSTMNGFPGVVGVIDGCHIPISAPTEYSNSYINRKGICGSVHDARVWQLSDIKYLMDRDIHGRYFPQQGHLLADSAYPLSCYMLTPYRDNGHLNHVQHNYNTKLSKTRVIIERAFGMLKGRFRKLKYVYMYNTDMIPLLILACCILHNICIDNEDEEPLEPLNENNENDYHNDAVVRAEEKRDIIAQSLFNL